MCDQQVSKWYPLKKKKSLLVSYQFKLSELPTFITIFGVKIYCMQFVKICAHVGYLY